ncbi:MAG TPA: hypothetical protein VER96_18575 [Polyangiaceae bacterium]|nr:hypothetical protein [Polyangiaceae bacterium]
MMFASLIETALLSSEQVEGSLTGLDSESFAFGCILATAFTIVAMILLVKVFPAAKAPQSQRSPRAPRSQREPPRSPRSVPRRVIRLYAVTPGQAEHEYNVGDPRGTRGSALIRVA